MRGKCKLVQCSQVAWHRSDPWLPLKMCADVKNLSRSGSKTTRGKDGDFFVINEKVIFQMTFPSLPAYDGPAGVLLMETVAGTPSLPLQRAETPPAQTLRPGVW